MKKGDYVRVLVKKSRIKSPMDMTVKHIIEDEPLNGVVGIRNSSTNVFFSVNADDIEPWVDAETPQTTSGVYEALGTQIGALVDEKQRQYGNSFGKCGDFLRILYPDGVPPEAYTDVLTLVRIFDKCMRIANGGHGDNESPYRDIAGYGLLGEMEAMKRKGVDAS